MFRVSLLGLHDERLLVGFGGVLGFTFVGHFGMVSIHMVSYIFYNLGAAVRQLHGVAALHGSTVAVLRLTEVQALIRVAHPVGEVVRLGRRFVGVYGGVVARLRFVGGRKVDGVQGLIWQAADPQSHANEAKEDRLIHLVAKCCVGYGDAPCS